MTTLDIKKGLFSICSSYLDKEDQKYITSTTDETFKCCLKYCVSPEKCYDICDKKWNTGLASDYSNLKKCIDTCDISNSQCTKICSLARGFTYQDDPFNICSSKKCLTDNNIVDSKCISSNKKELLECCRSNCTPTSTLDCEAHCSTSYDLATIQPKMYSMPVNSKINSKINSKESYTYIKNTGISIYILLSLFVFGITIFILLKNKKLILKT